MLPLYFPRFGNIFLPSADRVRGGGQHRSCLDLPRNAVCLPGPCSKRSTGLDCRGHSLRAHSWSGQDRHLQPTVDWRRANLRCLGPGRRSHCNANGWNLLPSSRPLFFSLLSLSVLGRPCCMPRLQKALSAALATQEDFSALCWTDILIWNEGGLLPHLANSGQSLSVLPFRENATKKF